VRVENLVTAEGIEPFRLVFRYWIAHSIF
jgi:hypothetical protein